VIWSKALAVAAALLMGTPAPASVVWIDLCDAAHPGRRIPLPIGGGEGDKAPGKACHTVCAAAVERRGRR
jgi:hypothetical protein